MLPYLLLSYLRDCTRLFRGTGSSQAYIRASLTISVICPIHNLPSIAVFSASTTVPHNGIKPRTGTKSRTEARLARCASRCPLYTSVDSDWPPSSRAQSARAVHARTSRFGRPTACLLRLSDDQSQGVLFAASVAARGETVVPSRHR